MIMANKQSMIFSILKRVKPKAQPEQVYKESFEQRLNRVRGENWQGQCMPPWHRK